MLKLLQTGTYSSWNKGDAAMQLSLRQLVRHRWPDSRVTISAPFPDHDVALYGDDAVVSSGRRSATRILAQFARVAAWRVMRDRDPERAEAILAADEELAAMAEADVVVDLSGDMLTDDYGPHVALSHYHPLILAHALERPVYVCAQSIGPFRQTGPLARFLLQRCAAITVRDALSLDNLADIDLQTPTPRQSADLAFLLEPVDDDRVRELWQRAGRDPDGPAPLGVSVSGIVQQRHDGARDADQPAFAETMAAALDEVAARWDVPVVFVSHVTGPTEDKDDRVISREVASHMSAEVTVVTDDLRPDEVKGLIGTCRAFIGARMHANIAALSTGVPIVALSYSHKTPGIMATWGLEDRVIDAAHVDGPTLTKALDALLGSEDEVRATMAARRDDVLAGSRSNLDEIDAILASAHATSDT
ncbi:polysaccharide pyruvyl transferase family protein [Salsipaludibacter albus]|uniref:polysaccharide pyruvyl transferase family protein n=1 Tax=Salsipaludibacter albus TaxID=2849650 RepID=UPI001EE3E03F|nr:polysaccharide pyruvyl transferase family protein [Salsipaludibacter albus]MBY5162912.1 polysaccharide pyruvyl transferase family protein [Salsipaludibacter albus]